MATVRLAPNIPVRVDVKYADLVSGKFGAQLRLRGLCDGADGVVYVDHVPAMNGLLAVGAIAAIPRYDPDALPEKGLQVDLVKRSLIVTKVQAAGEKTGTFTITTNGATPAPAVPQPPAPAALVGGMFPVPTAQQASSEVGSGLPQPPKLAQVYLDCVEVVISKVVPALEALAGESGVVDQQAVVAAVATLFIARTKQLGL